MQRKTTAKTIILALLFWGRAALATDVTLLAGNQFNSDFEIGVSDPDTAEPAIQAEF